MLLVSLLLGLVVLLALYLASGRSGTEFSPDDFTTRRFDYAVMPLFGWTVKGIGYDNTTPAISELLVADNLITVQTNMPQRWLLVDDDTPGRPAGDRDARFLVRYLNEVNDTSNPYWVTWNDEHPNCAPIFWPEIAKLARQDMFLAIPEIMEFAHDFSDDNAEEFQQQLNELTVKAWFDLGSMDARQGNHERAVERFDEAIAIESRPEIVRAREESVAAE